MSTVTSETGINNPKDPALKVNQPWTIGTGEAALKVPNRWYAQPMETNDSPKGIPSQYTYDIFERVAHAGFGIIELADTAIQTFVDEPERAHLARYHQIILSEKPEHFEGVKKLIDFIRKKSPFGDKQLVGVQLDVVGPQSNPMFSDVFRTYEPRPGDLDGTPGKLLTDDDVEPIMRAFVHAAELAHKVGFNVIDVKCCHGYGLSHFLRPANKARDNWSWGGDFDNRVRAVEEILRRIRAAVKDPKFKITVRLSPFEGEGHPGGIGSKGPQSKEINLEESRKLIQRFVQAGAEMINMSAGTVFTWEWLAPSRPTQKVVPKMKLETKDPWFKQDWLKDYPLHHIRFAEEAMTALKEINREDIPIICSGLSAFDKHRIAVAEQCVQSGIAMAGVGRQTLCLDVDNFEQLCKTCDLCFPPLGPMQSCVGCAWYGPRHDLYMLTVTARQKAKKAAEETKLDDLVQDSITKMEKHLPGDHEIEKYSRTLIIRMLFLGYTDAIVEALDSGKANIDKLKAIRKAQAAFQSQKDKNDVFKGLSLMIDAIDEQLAKLVDQQGDTSVLSDILEDFRKWSAYPQFSPALVKPSKDADAVGGVGIDMDGLSKVYRYKYFVDQALKK